MGKKSFGEETIWGRSDWEGISAIRENGVHRNVLQRFSKTARLR